MTDRHLMPSANHDDVDTNPSSNPTFSSVLEARVSRRDLFRGMAGVTAMAAFGGVGLSSARAGGFPHAAHGGGRRRPRLRFSPVPKSLDDLVTIPPGYRHSVLFRLGDPIAAGIPDYKNDGTDEAASFEHRAGDHHDGMSYFGMDRHGRRRTSSSDHGLLCINHEAITPAYLHPAGPTIVGGVRTEADEVLREFYVHGVAVIEVIKKERKTQVTWEYRQHSRFNRRIHTLTDIELSGPAARTPSMITKYSTDGSRTRGTVNNCANGETPWGTYLTCEENWAGYFRRIAATDNPNRTPKELASFARYGVAGAGRELWATVTPDTADDLYGRWNAMKLGASVDGSDDYRNVASTYGWVVELDPFDPDSTPKKRTALGRLAHEGAWPGPVEPGKPLAWYMGCDSRNEYIYKYVSRRRWNPRDADGGLAAGDKYLDDGTLYAARFNADGTGTWLELTFGLNNITPANPAYAFADQADVVINARLAADAAGATKMDRPEWGAVNPKNGDVYMTLTNTSASARPINKVDAANPRFYNDERTTGEDQKGNPNGHIIRFAEAGGRVDATSFTWDVFLFGARATADPGNVNLSGLTDANDFSSPDGAWFSCANPGLLWLQTDDGAYTDVTNCMMLAAIPGEVGDGAARTVTNVDGAASSTVDTHVGEAPGEDRLRRFLVGPKECEITGITETPDGKTIFVNIQHPGENTPPDFVTHEFGSHWPDGGVSRPRSATIAITRDDGGDIGLG
jgi:secreted PhoX family phosphatase